MKFFTAKKYQLSDCLGSCHASLHPTAMGKSQQASQHTGSAGSQPTCQVCTEGIVSNQPNLRCVTCAKVCHLSCLVAAYKQKSGIPLKNGIEWLAEFVEQTHLHFTCESCANQTANNSVIGTGQDAALAARVDDLNNQVSHISNEIASMSKVLSSMAASTMPSSSASTGADLAKAVVASTSYASVLTKSIKTAIAEHKQADVDNCSIAVYGFPEGKSDYDELYDMFAFLGCRSEIVHYRRIGRPDNQRSKRQWRPIKVTLRTASDCQYILSHASHLRDDAYYVGVFIGRWMSQEEASKLRDLRKRCDELNKGGTIDCKGRKAYLVVSGKLMMRHPNGKLARVESGTAADHINGSAQQQQQQQQSKVSSSSVSSSSSLSAPPQSSANQPASQPKNAAAGSQVAP